VKYNRLVHHILTWSHKTNVKAVKQIFIPALGLGSPKLKVDVKNPNGKAPIPNDMWKPPSPNPKPGKPYKNEKYDSKTMSPALKPISVYACGLIS